MFLWEFRCLEFWYIHKENQTKGSYIFYWWGEGGGVGWAGLGLFGCIVFSKVVTQQKKSMTLHKRSPKNVWPSPSPHPSWCCWSLLLRIVVCPAVTTLWQNAEFHLCHKAILKCCADDPSNKHYIRIFVKERTSVNFKSERKCCGIDQMFVANMPTRSQVQIGKDSSGIDSGICACGEWSEGHMFN